MDARTPVSSQKDRNTVCRRESAVSPQARIGCSETWQDAYLRFETPEEERRKFHARFRRMGATRWPRDVRILELFCGRGNGLVALEEEGFTDIQGADLSENLLSSYRGPARLSRCDCRSLPFGDGSFQRIIIQGGLHHLPKLPEDLEQTLGESSRVLTPDGLVFIVEPWRTIFLTAVHAVTRNRIVRRLSPKCDALATMVLHEHDTYYGWLHRADMILETLYKFFTPLYQKIEWGKITFVGGKTSGGPRSGSGKALI